MLKDEIIFLILITKIIESKMRFVMKYLIAALPILVLGACATDDGGRAVFFQDPDNDRGVFSDRRGAMDDTSGDTAFRTVTSQTDADNTQTTVVTDGSGTTTTVVNGGDGAAGGNDTQTGSGTSGGGTTGSGTGSSGAPTGDYADPTNGTGTDTSVGDGATGGNDIQPGGGSSGGGTSIGTGGTTGGGSMQAGSGSSGGGMTGLGGYGG
jgi:hypothetical protein